MYTTHRTVGSVIPHVYAKKHTGGEQGMVEGRVHTHGTLSAVRKRTASAPLRLRAVAKYGKPDLNSELYRGRPVDSELSRCRSAAVLPS